MIVFGPIPSRRLGRSLGINNIPFKYCTYSCVYCQLGLTNSMTTLNRNFFSPDKIFEETEKRLEQLRISGEKVDYITFVPDGEPTLDINLGVTIGKLKTLGIKLAVITNSSLLIDKNIRNELMLADWVSLKIDTAFPDLWKKINRPHGCLNLESIINGMMEFASGYKGELVTETMLVKNINDGAGAISKTAQVIKTIKPQKAYILIPIRPPAEEYVTQPDESTLNAAYQIFTGFNIDTELLIHDEGVEFTCTSDAEKELLSILAVHPMRIDAVKRFLTRSNSKWDMIENMIAGNKIKEVVYNRNSYFASKYQKELLP
jgi:wyosine [tRNA(Phe)-imidazoG37] synthetase (radical SAM superfamily)